MIVLTILLFFSLAVSVTVSGVLFWFNRRLIEEKESIREDLITLKNIVGEFSEFLNRVSKLDTIYGDPIVASLVTKTSDMLKDLEEFSSIYFEEEMDGEAEDNSER